MKVSHLYIRLIAIIAIVLTACTGKEDEDPSKPSRVAFVIKAANDPSATDNELINTWFIAFADASGKICRTIERDATKTEPVDMEEFSTKLNPGTYKVYSFANIKPSELNLDLVEGKTIPDNIASYAWTDDVTKWGTDRLIPMTGMQTVNVTGQITQPFAVEVVRLVAKMELLYSNASQSDITLHSLSIHPIGTGNVMMFPDYKSLGSAPTLHPDADTITVTQTLDTNLTAGTERGFSHRFYMLESNAERFHPTGHYVLTLDLTHRSGETNSAARDTITMLTPELSYINRNDYILIPVRIADYVLKMDVRFYPPIGGYPAVVNEIKGGDYYIRFGTEGLFAITPLMREGAATAPWMQPSELDIAIINITGDPIFTKDPSYDALSGEIIGELGTTTGTAIVTLSVAAKGSQLSYTRTVYIIREDRK